MKKLAIALLALLTTAQSAAPALAHHHPRHIVAPKDIYIRGLRYSDHTANTRMGPVQVAPGGFITINTTSLFYSPLPNRPRYDLRVVIQDTSLPPNSSGGVLVFRLTNVRPTGTSLTAQLPLHPMFRNRSYHVTVFLIGPQPWHYAYAGVVTIR